MLSEYFAGENKITTYRTDTMLGENGEGGTWFYWDCTCALGRESEHKYRNPDDMYRDMRVHRWGHVGS